MDTRKKIRLNFLAVAFLLLAALALLGWSVENQMALGRRVLHSQDVLIKVGQEVSILRAWRSAAQGYALTGRAATLVKFRESHSASDGRLSELATLVADNP